MRVSNDGEDQKMLLKRSSKQCPLVLFSILSLLLVCMNGLSVLAQNATATLSGTVVDQNGAVLPAVNISVISLAHGFQRLTTTNGEGHFVVPLLPPGTYVIKAERAGFAV